MPTPHRSTSANALRRDTLAVFPGMTIFWIGDLAHQGQVSGHNPDDYAPLRAELTDADNDPEVRAQDFMIGPKFTAADAARFVTALVTGKDRNRLYYVIYNRRKYRRATGFKSEPYTGTDPHTNHVHVSGWVGDDPNNAPWTSVLALKGDDMPTAAELWGTQFKDFVVNEAGERPLMTASAALFSARADAYHARAEVTALSAKLDALTALVAAAGGDVDVAAVLAGVEERLNAFREQVRIVVDEELDEQSRAGADDD